MPRKSEIKFHHYREIAAMATWWKAIFLTPIWAFLLIMPFGAFIRFFLPSGLWIASFVLVIALGLLYFLRDLNRRFVTVTDKDVYFGMGSYSLSNLRRIKIGYAFRFFNILPTKLVLDFEEEGLMRHLDLNLASISWQDSEAMLDLLSRRVSHLKIDDDVERLLQARKPLVVSPIQDPDHVEMKYHCRSLAEELPAPVGREPHQHQQGGRQGQQLVGDLVTHRSLPSQEGPLVSELASHEALRELPKDDVPERPRLRRQGPPLRHPPRPARHGRAPARPCRQPHQRPGRTAPRWHRPPES